MIPYSYIQDKNGEKLAIQIDLKSKNSFSIEEVEDLQDIIEYELLKHDETLNYDKEIANILNEKFSN